MCFSSNKVTLVFFLLLVFVFEFTVWPHLVLLLMSQLVLLLLLKEAGLCGLSLAKVQETEVDLVRIDKDKGKDKEVDLVRLAHGGVQIVGPAVLNFDSLRKNKSYHCHNIFTWKRIAICVVKVSV